MKIEVKGPIISDGEQIFYDWFGIPATSPNKVNNAIRQAKDGEELEVWINSGGGSMFAGSEIYTTLMDYKGDVIIKIVGLAASAASFIAMSGKVIEITPPGQVMIHNASCGAWGNKNDMNQTAEVLNSLDEGIAHAYKLRTGNDIGDLLEMMNGEKWMSATKAKELGFVDKIMFEEEATFINTAVNADGTLPQEVIDKIRNEMMVDGMIVAPNIENKHPAPSAPQEEPLNGVDIARAKLKLKLKIQGGSNVRIG